MQLVLEQLKEIEKLFLDLKGEAEAADTLLIVEGKKDIKSLNQLGVIGVIIQLEGRNIIEICDLAVKYKKVIILTDFDKSGEKLAKNLQNDLSSRGINTDLSYHSKLKFYFKKVSKDIESLSKIYKKVEQAQHKKMTD